LYELDQLEISTTFKAIRSIDLNPLVGSRQLLNNNAQTLRLMTDYYYRFGHLLITSKGHF